MAGYNQKPNELRIPLPPEEQEKFGDFNTLCVLLERRPVDYYSELIGAELYANRELLSKTWLKWEDFERRMKEYGYNFNRTTFWSYRKKGHFKELVKSDGVTTLYQLEGFLEHFSGKGATVASET